MSFMGLRSSQHFATWDYFSSSKVFRRFCVWYMSNWSWPKMGPRAFFSTSIDSFCKKNPKAYLPEYLLLQFMRIICLALLIIGILSMHQGACLLRKDSCLEISAVATRHPNLFSVEWHQNACSRCL